MKKLTYSSMALARLRANKTKYFSLVLGIFLAVFLVTVFFLAIQGFLLAQIKQSDRKIGKLDAYLLDSTDVSDSKLRELQMIEEIGHVYVTAEEVVSGSYIGYYDEIAEKHMYRTILDGRMPEAPGEIAIEESTLLALDLDRTWNLGDQLELTVLPIDGREEVRIYTLVGILGDQAAKLDLSNVIHTSKEFVKRFPSLLVSSQEIPYESGRIAVHRTFITSGGKLSGNRIEKYQESLGGYTSYGQFCIISAAGTAEYSDLPVYAFIGSESVVLTFVLGVLLMFSLLISCGIGIAGAMEGTLSSRAEEIGLLRAVGATKRQIRRIFGRESIIVGLLIAPLSILAGILAVAILAWMVPQQMILKLNPFFLLPIALSSFALIVVSGNAPLRRCSRLMPMSVIRDTNVLRKHKHIRSRKHFRVSRLISNRLLSLYPGRQIGSSVLTGMMLLSVFCLVICLSFSFTKVTSDTPAFEIIKQANGSTGYVDLLADPPISAQSLAQMRRLTQVSDVVIERNIDLLVLLDEPGEYVKSDELALYTEEEYSKLLEDVTNSDYYHHSMEQWKNETEKYNDLREKLQISQYFVKLNLTTIVLNEQTLREKYSHWVEEGKINIEAINAGKEVLVAAAKHWRGISDQGYAYAYRGTEPNNKDDVLVAENDTFYAGQVLPMIQLYCETDDYAVAQDFSNVQRKDTTVTVGAVLNNFDGSWFSDATIITTEEGLQNMGIYANGYDTYQIYLSGDIDQETEDILLQQLEAISSRFGWFYLRNHLKEYRENMTLKIQLISIFAAISILFSVVVISMIVSFITRRLQSDGRRIGMLRAVGADEKMILSCYTGQMNASLLGGFLASVIIVAVILITASLDGLGLYPLYGIIVMAVLTGLCGCICFFLLRIRIKNIISKSIIDNIREL